MLLVSPAARMTVHRLIAPLAVFIAFALTIRSFHTRAFPAYILPENVPHFADRSLPTLAGHEMKDSSSHLSPPINEYLASDPRYRGAAHQSFLEKAYADSYFAHAHSKQALAIVRRNGFADRELTNAHDARNGPPFKRVLDPRTKKALVEALSSRPDQYDLFNVHTISPENNAVRINNMLSLYTGDTIRLQGKDGSYINHYHPYKSHHFGLLAYTAKHSDILSEFTVQVLSKTQIRLISESGKYLECFCCWGGENIIAMHTMTPNPFSVFTVEPVEGGRIALKAETDEYLHPVYDREAKKYLLGVSSKLNDAGTFGVEVVARSMP